MNYMIQQYMRVSIVMGVHPSSLEGFSENPIVRNEDDDWGYPQFRTPPYRSPVGTKNQKTSS